MACGAGAGQAYWNACYGPNATKPTCQAWQQQNAACASCIDSNSTDAQWGAVLVDRDPAYFNVQGCMALMNDNTCAKAKDTIEQCVEAACMATCPVTDAMSRSLYTQCIDAAAKGGCKKWVDDYTVKSCPTSQAAQACIGATPMDSLVKIVPVFCGP
jgi:hypothetical protein